MKVSRSELREKIMTILYQIFMYQTNKMEFDLDNVIEEQVPIKNNFVNEIVNGVLDRKEELFNITNKYLTDWTIERLSKIDQAILSIGIYELLYTDTPEIVCINEAIELSKKYSDDKVRKMINGVLDKVYQDKE
ncbi:MAG: transcription antitermination factor NusB [Bacilli bacterium]|nr:transcription antitermination factor NusB [Bacilli bacterium]